MENVEELKPQPVEGTKSPRVIKITDQRDIDDINKALSEATLTREGIAEILADMQQALERRRAAQAANVWHRLYTAAPTAAAAAREGVEWVFDSSNMSLIEVLPQAQGNANG